MELASWESWDQVSVVGFQGDRTTDVGIAARCRWRRRVPCGAYHYARDMTIAHGVSVSSVRRALGGLRRGARCDVRSGPCSLGDIGMPRRERWPRRTRYRWEDRMSSPGIRSPRITTGARSRGAVQNNKKRPSVREHCPACQWHLGEKQCRRECGSPGGP